MPKPSGKHAPRRFDPAAAQTQQAPGGIAHEAGDLHRLLVESVQDYAIFALDTHGYILSWNAGAERFKGYTADEVIGKHFSIFYPPEKVAARFPQHELDVAARDGRFEDEGWRVRKDGTRFWANVVITALYDERGTLVGFGKVTRDLTARRAAEQRGVEDARRVAAEEAARDAADSSRERTEHLLAIMTALSAAYTTSDVTDVIANEGFRRLGVDAGAVALLDRDGEHFELLTAKGFHDIPAHLRRLALSEQVPIGEVLRTGRPVICATRAERDPRFPAIAHLLAPYESTIALPLTSHGKTVGALSVHWRDARMPDPETSAFVEAFAQQCGQAFERAQLYQTEQQARREAEEAGARALAERGRAEDANKTKGDFLATMSHELRTPLNAIGGYAQLLMMGVSGTINEEQRVQLERIRRSQEHLLRLINDILNFSRIDAGQISYNFGEVPLKDVLESVSAMVVPQARMNSIAFENSGCPPEAVIWADRPKVEQVLLNLLSNALKFTPAGGKVTLRCDHTIPDRVELAVDDTGEGIAPEQLDRIFEPFVQVGRSLTRVTEGTGLGLAISRDLARAMRGDIRVTSQPGVRTTFTLTLPRNPPATAA